MKRPNKGLTIVAGVLLVIAAFALAYERIPFPNMTTAESWGLILNGAGVAIAAGGLWVVWYQLWRHRVERRTDSARQQHELVLDHNRRQMQATIDYMTTVRQAWRTARRSIQKTMGKGPLNARKLEAVEADEELLDQVRGLLAGLEELAVGVNAKVFDGDLVNMMCGAFLIAVYDDFEIFIRSCQKELPSCYSEFEKLVANLKAKRKLPPGPTVKAVTDGWPEE